MFNRRLEISLNVMVRFQILHDAFNHEVFENNSNGFLGGIYGLESISPSFSHLDTMVGD